MNEDNASSYDLFQAQQFLDVLFSRLEGGQEKEPPVPVAHYASLATTAQKRREPAVPLPASAQVRDSNLPGEELVLQDFDSWEGCLAWCMTLTRADAAFVVDSQGFVIANRGRIPAEGFEGAGAELFCSIEQLERIAPDAGDVSCIDIDFDKRKIVGFVASSEKQELYVIGLVAPEPLSVEIKHGISRQLMINIANLD